MATEGVGEGADLVNETQFTLAEMQAAVEEAHRYGKASPPTPTVRTASAGDSRRRRLIEHGTLLDDEAVECCASMALYLRLPATSGST
jgi:imidazolonepropionase-like amidohydrolase